MTDPTERAAAARRAAARLNAELAANAPRLSAALSAPLPGEEADERCPCGRSHTRAEHGYDAGGRALTRREPTPWAATAKAVRAAVKARRTELGIPAVATISVTCDSFSGGASVDVDIDGVDEWAWQLATADDYVVRNGYAEPGKRILTDQARAVGAAIAQILRATRTAGYIWGSVTYRGTILDTVAREGWQPGQD